MIIFIYGEDTYRARQKLNEIVEHYKSVHKSGLNLRFLDCEEQNISIEDLKEKIRQATMFKEKKLVIITNLFSDAGLKEKFSKDLKEFLDYSDILMVFEENVKKTDPLFKKLIKTAKCQEFKVLEGQNLRNWLKKEVERNKGSIDSVALETLVDYVGNDLWQLVNEMQKLLNYKKNPDGNTIEDSRQGRNKTITSQDVKLLVKPKIETDIFKTIDAIGQKDKKQALNLLYKHLENGDSPLYLLSMVSYQFRNLLVVKELIEKAKPYSLIVKKSGLHPFVVKKSYLQSGKFTLPDLKKIYQKIFQVDLDIKTGKIEPEAGLEMLVAGI